MPSSTATAQSALSATPSRSAKSTPASTPPTVLDNDLTPEDGVSETMRKEEASMLKARSKEEKNRDDRMEKERQKDLAAGTEAVDKKFKALEYLLSQSKLYSTIMLSQMQKQEEQQDIKDEKDRKKAQKRDEKADELAQQSQKRATRSAAGQESNATEPESNSKRKRGKGGKATAAPQNKISNYLKKADVQAQAGSSSVAEALHEAVEADVKPGDIGIQNLKSARQPDLVTGGTMRTYQLEGLEWLISLYENGLNGILADEMGLGKTIQTISFLAFLREKQSFGPFLIAAPLSTTSNWVDEFKKFTPDIPVVLYHGSKPDREHIRNTRLKNPGSPNFPVVVTSYEICMNDRKFLANFGWKFIIIDEGHRIKNLNCKLIRELQQYRSANRLLITGTPLQNNLTELWSLLHFLMPDIFDKLEAFESWFDFSELKDKNGYDQLLNEDRQKTLVASLHAILKPFLLRRVKADVEKMLPKKREYVLYAPLTQMQEDLYQAILDGTSRNYLEDRVVERLTASGAATPNSVRSSSVSLKRKAAGSRQETPNKSAKTSRAATPSSVASGGLRSSTRRRRRNYEELDDDEYLDRLEKGEDEFGYLEDSASEAEEDKVIARTLDLAKQHVKQKKLKNPIMQLRLCCNHPYNFFDPYLLDSMAADQAEPSKDGYIERGEPDESIVTTSGKMMLLDSLLPELFREGHKVLIFSQFKLQLDLLESYADLRGWNYCRIDGSIAQEDRHAQIKAFNAPSNGKTTKNSCNLFFLSTRAGGQGINLVAADTVILYDSDWNPQQDLQAQDRAHRIGQVNNVIIYRLATRNTVEQTLLETAEGKRRLEKLVIRKGGVRDVRGTKAGKDKDEFEELQTLLRRKDGDDFDMVDGRAVLSEKDLAILTDRSDEAYVRAEKGEGDGDAFRAVEFKGDTGLLEGLKA